MSGEKKVRSSTRKKEGLKSLPSFGRSKTSSKILFPLEEQGS
jgi:hypothetical protein